MTLTELLGLSADDWDKLPNDQLLKILEPYLKATRPETGRLKDEEKNKRRGTVGGLLGDISGAATTKAKSNSGNQTKPPVSVNDKIKMMQDLIDRSLAQAKK